MSSASRDVDTNPVLPDVLAPDLKLVFCGSAAGAASARKRAYYAGPGNKFWPILAETGLTPSLLAPAEFSRLPEWGMGLTDMAKHVSGSDASLSREADDPAGLTRKINIFKPSTLAFVGKRAGQVWLRHQFDLKNPGYGLQPVSHDATAIFILPSTSGAANGFWDPLPWYDLAAHIRLIEKESL